MGVMNMYYFRFDYETISYAWRSFVHEFDKQLENSDDKVIDCFKQRFINYWCNKFEDRFKILHKFEELYVIFKDVNFQNFVKLYELFLYVDSADLVVNSNVKLLLLFYNDNSIKFHNVTYNDAFLKYIKLGYYAINENNITINSIYKCLKKYCKKLNKLDFNKLEIFLSNKFTFNFFEGYFVQLFAEININSKIMKLFLEVSNTIVCDWYHKPVDNFEIIEKIILNVITMINQEIIKSNEIKQYIYLNEMIHHYQHKDKLQIQFIDLICNGSKINDELVMIYEKIRNGENEDIKQYAKVMFEHYDNDIKNIYYQNYLEAWQIMFENSEVIKQYCWGNFVIAYNYKSMSLEIKEFCDNCNFIKLKNCKNVNPIDFRIIKLLTNKNMNNLIKKLILCGKIQSYNYDKPVYMIESDVKNDKINYDDIIKFIGGISGNHFQIINILCGVDGEFINPLNFKYINEYSNKLSLVFSKKISFECNFEKFDGYVRFICKEFGIGGSFQLKDVKYKGNNNNNNFENQLGNIDINKIHFNLMDIVVPDGFDTILNQIMLFRRLVKTWSNNISIMYKTFEEFGDKLGAGEHGVSEILWLLLVNMEFPGVNDKNRINGKYKYLGEIIKVEKVLNKYTKKKKICQKEENF